MTKKVVDKACITESAYRVCRLGNAIPSQRFWTESPRCWREVGILERVCVQEPSWFAYALLENEDIIGYTARDIDETAAIATGSGPAMDFFSEFIHDWEEARKKLDNREIIQEEYEEWKRTWDSGAGVKTDDGKNPYTNK